jgi:aldose 1-epimerase
MITLTVDDASFTLAPEFGGAVVEWRRKGLPMFRPTDAATLAQGKGRMLASYPLVPFSNRIANRRFSWAGKTYDLPEQFSGYAIHGVGYLRAWEVAEQTANSVTITLDQPPCAEWPFALRTWQRFVLTGDSLTSEIGVQNTDTVAWPAGIGQHPFFPRSPGLTLTLQTVSVWLNGGASLIPTERVKVPPEWDFSKGGKVGPVYVDNGFAGFGGTARLEYADLGYALTIQADKVFGHTVIFVPNGQSFFAVEPVSHMNDAINRMDSVPDHGLVVLEPGGKLEGRIVYAVSDL